MAGSRERSSSVRHDSIINRLPGALVDHWEWQRRGNCRGMDSSVFYSPDDERGPARRRREKEAKKVCKPCPVREECLLFALKTVERYGVWGGTTEEERRQLLKKGMKGTATS